MHTIRLSVLTAVATSALCAQGHPFRTASIFGDHMAMPKQAAVPIHGFGPAGAKVVLRPSWGEPVETTVGIAGRWQATVTTPAQGTGGSLALACGDQRQTIDDILFGDVWLASGQSNMEWTLAQAERPDVVAAASHRQLRVFTVRRVTADTPARDVEGEWAVCTPEVAEELSAVGYHFARELLANGHGPIGLVVSSWGGTRCEAWTSESGLAAFPEFAADLKAMRSGSSERLRLAQRELFFAAVDALPKDRMLQEVQLPEVWSASWLKNHDGVVDYRRRLHLPDDLVGRELRLELGAIDDMDTVLWNGTRVAGSERDGVWHVARDYVVPAVHTRRAAVDLLVRVIDTGGEGGFTGPAERMRLTAKDGGGSVVSLAGRWQRSVRGSLDQLPPWPRARGGANRPSVLWNGMVEPLLPFPFAGVIWYQGESNRGKPDQYARLFPAMIRDWRRALARELPFLFVQIAPYRYTKDGSDLTAKLRDAQAAALRLPATGMVVTLDVGDPDDIHPRDKQPVGQRLALLARRLVYGEHVLCRSPRAVRAEREGDAVRVHFASGHGGLELVGDGGFRLLDGDRRWHRASARIDGSTVVVAAEGMRAPVEVRYAWSAAPAWSVRSVAGLPAAPFRLVVE